VQSRAGAPDAPAEAPPEPPKPAAPRYAPSPVRRPPYPPYQPMRQPLPQLGRPMPPPRGGFGLPSLRRNVCPHFYMTGSRGAIPIQAPHLLKGLLRQPNNVSRCQLRGGVHLDEGYVNDVCLTPRFNQCVFYEDELTKE
jgi:hypothetical protein